MKIKIKRREFTPLMAEMKALTGLPLKKALSFGKDQRMLQAEIDTFADFEKTKDPRLVELQKQFDEKMKAAKGETSEQEILKAWNDAGEFIDLLSDYRKSESEFLNEETELSFKTTFEEKDLKLDSVSAKAGWMLTFFMK